MTIFVLPNRCDLAAEGQNEGRQPLKIYKKKTIKKRAPVLTIGTPFLLKLERFIRFGFIPTFYFTVFTHELPSARRRF